MKDSKHRDLRIFLDVMYERGSQDFYNNTIRPALLTSHWLIVIATPDAQERAEHPDWIAREIADFLSGPNAQNIIVVLAKGQFNDELPGNIRQFSPNVQIVDFRNFEIPYIFNPIKRAILEDEVLKIVGPLYGIPLEEMPNLRREQERNRFRRRFSFVVACFMALGFVAWSFLSLNASDRLAIRNDTIAIAALSESLHKSGNNRDALILALSAWPKNNGLRRPMLKRVWSSFSSSLGAKIELGKIRLGDKLLYTEISLDGSIILSRTSTETVLWDVIKGYAIKRWTNDEGGESYFVLSPDGKYLLRAAKSKIVEIIYARNGESVATIIQNSNQIIRADFAPVGERVLLATVDGNLSLWQFGNGEPLEIPMPYKGPLVDVSFSSDGMRILTLSNASPKNLQIWNGLTGALLSNDIGAGADLWGISFSPNSERFVTSSSDTTQLWDSRLLSHIGPPLEGGSPVFSPDGTKIVTISENVAHIWDAANGAAVGIPLRHMEAKTEFTNYRISDVKFSSDSKYIVTSSSDQTARVWSASSGESVGSALQHMKAVRAAVFSPDGKRVVTVSDDATARLWSSERGIPIGSPMVHEGAVYEVRFINNGSSFLTLASDATARVWSADDGPIEGALRHGEPVNSVSFSPDGRYLITASDDRTARIWETETGRSLYLPLRHTDEVIYSAYSPDGLLIATADLGVSDVKIWNPNSREIPIKVLDHRLPVDYFEFLSHLRIVTSSWDKKVRLWNINNEELACKEIDPTFESEISRSLYVRVSPDKKRIVTITGSLSSKNGGNMQIWNVENCEQVGKNIAVHRSVTSVVFSNNGVIGVVAPDNIVGIYEIDKGETVQLLGPYIGRINDIIFSPNGDSIFIASGDSVKQVNVSTGNSVGNVVSNSGVVYSVAFNEINDRIATASGDKTVAEWDSLTGKPIGEAMRHDDTVRHVSYSPDGRLILTLTSSGKFRVWDTGSHAPIGEVRPYSGVIETAHFSPDGSSIVTKNGDGVFQLWKAPRYRYTGINLGCEYIGVQPDIDYLAIKYEIDNLEPICGDDSLVELDWDLME